jgi:hypothetical protein
MGRRERGRALSQTRQFVTPRNGQGVQTPAGMPERSLKRSPPHLKTRYGLQSQVRYAASQRYQASPVLKPLKAKGKQGDGRLLRTAVKRRSDPALAPENDHEIESLVWTARANGWILRAARKGRFVANLIVGDRHR